eukprot:SAG31_NODE_973_length_10632_cov_7.175622_5_plen_301_part_00
MHRALCITPAIFAIFLTWVTIGGESHVDSCRPLLHMAAASGATVRSSEPINGTWLLRVENACINELQRQAMAPDDAQNEPQHTDKIGRIYDALLWLCGDGAGTPVETTNDGYVAEMARPVLEQFGAFIPSSALPFYRALASYRRVDAQKHGESQEPIGQIWQSFGAASAGKATHRQGLMMAHAEVLAARTPGLVAFTLHAAKLGWKANATHWGTAVIQLSRRAAAAPCTPTDYKCHEQPLATELEVLALTRQGNHEQAAQVLRKVLAVQPDNFARAYGVHAHSSRLITLHFDCKLKEVAR